MNRLTKRIAILIAIGLLLNGCSWFHIYRRDIQQGNVVTQDMVDKLKPGMTEDQVRYIMGTPLLTNTLQPNRWDYVYTFQPGGGERVEKRVALIFDQRGILRQIEIVPNPLQNIPAPKAPKLSS